MIPCGSAVVANMPVVRGYTGSGDTLENLMQQAPITTAHGVTVGSPFQMHGMVFFCESFEADAHGNITDEVEGEEDQEDEPTTIDIAADFICMFPLAKSYYVVVNTWHGLPDDFNFDGGVDVHVDISHVPYVWRAHLGLLSNVVTAKTYRDNDDKVYTEYEYFDAYCHCLRVTGNHTMHQIYEAISQREGWPEKMPEVGDVFLSGYGELKPENRVEEIWGFAAQGEENVVLNVCWPSIPGVHTPQDAQI